MKTAIRFQNTVKKIHGAPAVCIDDLQIYDRECVAFYGLPEEIVKIITNEITGACTPETGSIYFYGTESRNISEAVWFHFIEHFGIYTPSSPFVENASIGENIARLFRNQNESIEEPQLSAAVLNLANLVQLTITDLSRTVKDSGSLLRAKLRLAQTLSSKPRMVAFFEPTDGMRHVVAKKFVELIRRTRRKLKYTLLLFTSDIRFMQQLADRVFFLNPVTGLVVENQLREWYHNLLPFLQPSPSKLLQLARNILQYGGVRGGARVKG